MAHRRHALFVTLALLASPGALFAAGKVQTPNFVVEAPTPQLAQEFGRLAEHYRKEKAIQWLGREMPQWPQPCPLKVTVTMNGAGGATSFNFTGNQVFQQMHIEGALERLKHSVLPHEVTHTVLAHHFRQPVPRWADEGGSVLSEDDVERRRHDQMCRDILNAGRGMTLRRLFSLKDYPQDVMVLYAEGFSITRFLVESADRQTFLNFLGHGMQYGWDSAVQTVYRYQSVEALEKAWLDHLRRPRQAIASNNPTPPPSASAESARLVVRTSSPPAQPILEPPVVARGVPPTPGKEQDRFGGAPVRLSQPEVNAPVRPAPSSSVAAAPPSPLRPMNAAEAPRRPAPPPPVVLFPPEPVYPR